MAVDSGAEAGGLAPYALLRQGLVADGIACGLVGSGLVVASRWVSRVTGLGPAWAPGVAGASFLPWGTMVFQLGRRQELNSSLVTVVLGGNLLYIGVSIGVLLSGVLELIRAGKWTVGVLAWLVVLFTVVQSLGVRRLQSTWRPVADNRY